MHCAARGGHPRRLLGHSGVMVARDAFERVGGAGRAAAPQVRDAVPRVCDESRVGQDEGGQRGAPRILGRHLISGNLT